MDLDDTLERIRTLIAQRDAVYNELAALLGGDMSKTSTKRKLTCSICQSDQHTARTCPNKDQAHAQ